MDGESLSAKPLVSRPPSGHWVDAYPDLGKGPISLDDSVSPAFYEKERAHIFKKNWLYMGRVEQLPKAGSYFTRELKVADTSVIIVRDKDDTIRAFHNMCAHRGNKLIWDKNPFAETKGATSRFYCRFHGWSYKLDGALANRTRKDLFYELDNEACKLASIQCEVWEGFIFINLDAGNKQSVRDFLGDFAKDLEGYPFEKMTKGYPFRIEVNCNWKVFMDGFAEGYHTPYLHGGTLPDVEAGSATDTQQANAFADSLGMQFMGLHRMVSWPGQPARRTAYSTPMECLLEAGPLGLWNKVDIGPMPRGINPSRSETCQVDSFQFFPNFVLVFWKNSTYSTHAHWPTGPHSHIFEITFYFPEPQTFRQRLGQELTMTLLHDVMLQDCSPLEGMQAMLQSGAITQFHCSDEELLVRHLHKVVGDVVAAAEQKQGAAR